MQWTGKTFAILNPACTLWTATNPLTPFPPFCTGSAFICLSAGLPSQGSHQPFTAQYDNDLFLAKLTAASEGIVHGGWGAGQEAPCAGSCRQAPDADDVRHPRSRAAGRPPGGKCQHMREADEG